MAKISKPSLAKFDQVSKWLGKNCRYFKNKNTLLSQCKLMLLFEHNLATFSYIKFSFFTLTPYMWICDVYQWTFILFHFKENYNLNKWKKVQQLNDFISILVSGEYLKLLKQDDKVVQKEIIQDKIIPVIVTPTETQSQDHQLMPPPPKQMLLTTTTNSANKINQEEEEEDSAIQNLLDDIRGSFERQFDDEFNDLTENDAINEESAGGGGNEESRTSSPLFGNINIGSTFSISDGQALEDLAAEDLIPSSPDEMPLEGLSISQEVFDLGFLDPFHQGTEDQPF